MHRNCIRYRDTWAAPGSQLHAALTDGDQELAAKIYRQCEDDARKLVPPAPRRYDPCDPGNWRDGEPA